MPVIRPNILLRHCYTTALSFFACNEPAFVVPVCQPGLSFKTGLSRVSANRGRELSMRSDCPTTPRVSLIVPVYNGGDRFRACLQSLAQIAPQSLEVIVVADGDTDGSWQVAQDWGARVLRLSSPSGPARARNLGAKEARGDILLFIDADVTVPRNIIEHITTIMSAEPHVAAVIGSYDDHPAATNFLSQYKNLFHHYVHQTSSQDASTFGGLVARFVVMFFSQWVDSMSAIASPPSRILN